MKVRDFDFIESRLLSPTTPAMEAYARLMEAGENVLARELMGAMIEFQDKCRNIRQRLKVSDG